jgi:iron complex outermembrane receptor protein
MSVRFQKMFFVLLSMTFLSQICLAQTYGILSGKILEENGTPLIGANVRIEKTLLGSATTAKGTFKIIKIPIGKISVRISMIGFETKFIEDILIKPDEETILEVRLKQSPIETKEVVITASKYEQKISEIPVSINLINSLDLKRKNITNFDDALRYVPGVNVTYDQVSIRGSNGYSRGAGSRVMILFDGIPLFSGDTGEIIFQIIPIHEIERVEIVKGSGSALYGSSAMGGVINIISKETSGDPVYYFKTYTGIFGKPYYDEWNWTDRTRMFNGLILSHSRRIGDLGLSFSFFRYQNDSYRLNNFTKRYNLFLKSKYNLSTSENLSLLLNMVTYNNGIFIFWRDSRNALMPPEDVIGQTVDAFRFNSHLIYQKAFSDNFLFNAKLSLFHNDWRDLT